MTVRNSQAGVTLIEMLAALSVAAMIGVAGFTFLDSVTTRDAQLTGRLDRLLTQDRAFRVFARDAADARRAVFSENTDLMLVGRGYTLIWQAGDADGLTRRIVWPDGREMSQTVLSEPVQLFPHPDKSRAIVLSLPQADIRWLIALPTALEQ